MITPTTELEAVNTLLRSIGESPVSSLNGPLGVDVVTARQTLNEVIRSIQMEGWIFNTEYDFPLMRDLQNEIQVPSNALVVDVARSAHADIEPVLRGRRMYDRMNHTYTFDRDLEAKVILGLSFDEMPETGRYYAVYRAARKFESNSLGSGEQYQFNSRDEMVARSRFVDEQMEDEDLNYLADTPGLNRILLY